MLGHLDPEFIALLDETNERLRAVMRTANPLTFPVSGTGSAGMEAAVVNALEPGDIIVVGVNGVFGGRLCDVADRCGATVIRVDAPWGSPVPAEALLEAHPNPKVIAVVQAETSTGVRTDVADIGANKGEALLLIDCVTSVAGSGVDIDDWGVDIAYSGTQKCLGAPPGLAPLTLSPQAIDQIVARPQSWYLDLNMIAGYVTGARAYHHTAPISMIFSLHAALGAVLEEGLEAAEARHHRCGEMLQAGLEKLGLELFAQEGFRLPQLTSVLVPKNRLPPGMTEADVRSELMRRYGIEVGGGLGEYAGKLWRIGCMGHTARERNVSLVLGAIDELLAS